jgi:glucose-6-phosphate 1-epimerase
LILRSRHQRLDTLLLETDLARCEIALYGAQVLSFVPKADGRDLLWCSPARLAAARPIRGGVPVCWPWFARQGVPESAPQHGFVRTTAWEAESAVEGPDGTVDVVLALRPDFPGWPPDCVPRLTVSVGSALGLTLETVNGSDRTVTLTQALHSYFRVGHVAEVLVDGLQGSRYLDKLRGFAEFRQSDPWRFDGACDRIYVGSGPVHLLRDPVLDRVVRIESAGSAATVVWNPGADGIGAFPDVPPCDWFQYLCIEAANCGPHDVVTLAPGERTRLAQRVSVAAVAQ